MHLDEARRLRAEITATKAHLKALYDRRAQLIKLLEHDMTTREMAEVFGVKQPLIVDALNHRRTPAPAPTTDGV